MGKNGGKFLRCDISELQKHRKYARTFCARKKLKKKSQNTSILKGSIRNPISHLQHWRLRAWRLHLQTWEKIISNPEFYSQPSYESNVKAEDLRHWRILKMYPLCSFKELGIYHTQKEQSDKRTTWHPGKCVCRVGGHELNLSSEASPSSDEPSSRQRGGATGQQTKFSPTTSLHLTTVHSRWWYHYPLSYPSASVVHWFVYLLWISQIWDV